MKRILSILLALPFAVGHAEFLDLPFNERFDARRLSIDSVRPNETQPADALPFWKAAPMGVYVAVGTERGFLGASASKASHLLLVDINEGAVAHNRLNILLLAAARDRQDFLKLREMVGDRKFDEILGRLKESRHTKNADVEFLKLSRVRDLLGSVGQNLPTGEVAANYFTDVNYYRFDDQFNKLQKMARKGRIEARYLDLYDGSGTREITQAIRRAGLKVSVLDVSNVGFESKQLRKLLEMFHEVGHPKALVLDTVGAGDYGLQVLWSYRAARLDEYVESLGKDASPRFLVSGPKKRCSDVMRLLR